MTGGEEGRKKGLLLCDLCREGRRPSVRSIKRHGLSVILKSERLIFLSKAQLVGKSLLRAYVRFAAQLMSKLTMMIIRSRWRFGGYAGNTTQSITGSTRIRD